MFHSNVFSNTSCGNISQNDGSPISDETVWRFCLSAVWLVLSYAGNSMIVLVMTSRTTQPRANTTKFLFCALAVTDMSFTTVVFLRIRDIQILMFCSDHVKPQARYFTICVEVIFYTLRELSTWILVMLSAERCSSALRPFKVKRFCSLKHIKWTLLAISLVLAGMTTLFLVFEVMRTPFLTFDSLNVAIPFFLITVTTAAISVRRLEMLFRNTPRPTHYNSTSLLLSANACFILMVMPVRIVKILLWHKIFLPGEEMVIFIDYLYYMKYVFNFYIYFATSAKFRKNALTLVGCRCEREQQTRNEESNMSPLQIKHWI